MYNSVCFIILSWVFAVLVFPGKTFCIPRVCLCPCLQSSVLLSVAYQPLLTRSGALLKQPYTVFYVMLSVIIICQSHSVRLVGTSSNEKLIC